MLNMKLINIVNDPNLKLQLQIPKVLSMPIYRNSFYRILVKTDVINMYTFLGVIAKGVGT